MNKFILSVPQLHELPAGTTWGGLAVCLQPDALKDASVPGPDLFYPSRPNNDPGILQGEEARDICRRCPVADLCLRAALNCREESGVWGGLTEPELKRALKSQQLLGRAVVDVTEVAAIRSAFARPLLPSIRRAKALKLETQRAAGEAAADDSAEAA